MNTLFSKLSQGILLLLLLLLLTAIEFSLGGSSPYTGTVKTYKNKIYINETIQTTAITSTHITKTPTHYKPHRYANPHIRKEVQTTTVQFPGV
jgi:hypothetical protein